MLIHKAAKARCLRLFMDYDGTLADFAPSPDTLLPDPELITLIESLVNTKGFLPAIISGRKLAHISKLLPVKKLLLAGTYGIEMQLSDGQYRSAVNFQEIRPVIENILPLWQKLVANKNDFYLEDKGWSIALHGRYASEIDSLEVMETAHRIIRDQEPDPRFRFYKGERFLEYAPVMASKTLTAQWIMENATPKDALCIFIGDDDKDEDAFSVPIKSGGFAVRVTATPCKTQAQISLNNPVETRTWLKELLSIREHKLIS